MKREWFHTLIISAVLSASFLIGSPAHASIAYGSLNNFDAVNDTGVPCHGFEIEIEDIHSRDITYTYDYNHYGVPKITEDNSDPLHPRVYVRYESKKNPDGTWASYTAVPSGPISPTDGHQFTNPSINFGGEHFGVGFYGIPTGVRYFWLIDDGAGNLIRGGVVNISTPAFTYFPPVGAIPAQVQAVIEPPPPPELPILEFGEPMWVKETRTETHNNNKVELRDLVPDDPDDPNDRNWANGEPEEVEVEWSLLQTEFNSPDGGPNGELAGAPEDLPNGDEIITRRYDFFKYVGPLDEESGEAKADSVGPDDIHGVGIKTINGASVDLSTVVVVGDYIGAQMAGFDPAGQIGLIDHLQDGEVDLLYPERTIVIGGAPPIVTTRSGPLPEGMSFDEITGVLSGTPTVAGTFTFTIQAADANAGSATATYHLTILESGFVEPLHITVTALASPPEGGSAAGSGEYVLGATVTVMATANPGFEFMNWTDGGTIVSSLPTYEFIADINRELVANFAPPEPPTPTQTETLEPTATSSQTPVPPAPTPTNTLEATATNTETPVLPTPTDTPAPEPSATSTDTPVLPTATFTDTPVQPVTATPTALASHLVAHWKLDGGTGETAIDSTGNGAHGMLLNGPTWVGNGVLAGALSFDGVDDTVDVGKSDFNLGSEMSISLWVLLKGNGPDFYQTLIKRGVYVYPFSIRFAGHRIQSIIRTSAGANYLISNTNLPAGNWYHIAVTYRNGERILYINGEPHKSDAPEGSLSIRADQHTILGGRISNSGETSNANVILDDVRIYNVALSGEEIQALYEEGALPMVLTSAEASNQTDSEDLPRMIKALKNEGQDIAIQFFELSSVWRK